MRTLPLLSGLRSLIIGYGLRRQLARAERRLLLAEPGQRAVLLTELCDLHLQLGDGRKAAGCLGSAIDACLALGHLESAATLCRKMLNHFPGVVRAHGTLGFLLLARGSYRQAEWELAQYLSTSRNDGTASYAIERLRMTAPAFPELEARILLGRLLRQAGNIAAAEAIEELSLTELKPPAQRKLLAALLRRSVRAHLVTSSGDETTFRLSDGVEDEEHLSLAPSLPLLDTTVLRATIPATSVRPAPPAPPIRPQRDDLPWMDTSLPAPAPEAEDQAAEHGASLEPETKPAARGRPRSRRRPELQAAPESCSGD